jgi:hypothetical protein
MDQPSIGSGLRMRACAMFAADHATRGIRLLASTRYRFGG